MASKNLLAWDIGGANLKLLSLDQQGQIKYVDQIEMPLWQGLDRLEQALLSVPESIRMQAASHAVTMTAELVDIFPDRITGVREILAVFSRLMGDHVHIYAAQKGWLTMDQIEANEAAIASANWHATARFIGTKIDTGLLIDIGSTTTDIIAIIDGQPANLGTSDQARLQFDELVYTGIERSPIASIVSRIPMAGEWQQIATEYFASSGDVYCLTGDLPENSGFRSADGRGTSLLDCARRLARLSGHDLHEADLHSWQQLAAYIRQQHMQHINQAICRVTSRFPDRKLAMIGAGAGRFLIPQLATWHDVAYYDFADLVEGEANLKQDAAICAPAAACAYLRRLS